MRVQYPRLRVQGGHIRRQFEYLYGYAQRYCRLLIRKWLIEDKISFSPDPDDLAHDVLAHMLALEPSQLKKVKDAKVFIQRSARQSLEKYDRGMQQEQAAEIPGPSFPDPDWVDRKIDVQAALARFEATFAQQRPSASGKDYPAQQLAALHHICWHQGVEKLRELGEQLGVGTERARQVLERAMRRLRHPSYTRQVSVWVGRLTHEERMEFEAWQRQMNDKALFWGLKCPYPHLVRRDQQVRSQVWW